MNFNSIFQAALGLLIYYSCWSLVSTILNDYVQGGHYWGPLNAVMIGFLPSALVVIILLRGLRDER